MARATEEAALIGRTAELAKLIAALDGVRDHDPAIGLLYGDAGVGKTRLLSAFAQHAQSSGARALVGGCLPVAEGEFPFAPVIEAFRGVEGGPDLTAVGSLSPSTQPRMFELFLGAVGRLAADRVLVLAIEDLHWADRSTLNLLAFLARNLRKERVLIMLTFRGHDLARTSPVRRWLSELSAVRPPLRLHLAPLSRADSGLQIAALLGHEPDPSLVDAVYARSEGNPLVTETLISAGAAEGGVPSSLRDFVLGRVYAMPADAQDLVRIAAVAGRQVRHETLVALSGLSEDDVLAGLRSAVDQHVVVPDADGFRYGFGHALIREVVYAELLPVERRRLHAAMARRLAAVPVTRDDRATRAAEIAHHWHAAGEEAEALPAAVQAGFDAMGCNAFDEALHHLRRALQLWDQVPEPEGAAGTSRLGIEAAASEAAHLVGDDALAVALAEDALGRLSETDRVERARLHNRIGSYYHAVGQRELAATAYRRTLQVLSHDEVNVERARAMAGLARIHVGWSELDNGQRLAEAAIAVASDAGDRHVEARAHNTLGLALAQRGDLDQGLAELRHSLAMARELEEPDDIALGYINTGYVLGLAGRYDESTEVSLEGYRAMRDLGLERQDGSFLQANAAGSLLASGRWEEAAPLLEQAEARRPRGPRAFSVLVYATRACTGRGDFAGARARLDRIARLLAEGAVISWQRWYLELYAETAVWEGRASTARQAVRDGLSLVAGTDEERFAGTLVALGLRVEADAADRARAAADEAALDESLAGGESLLERVRGFRWDPLDATAAIFPEAGGAACTARAELGRLRGNNEPGVWLIAARAWADRGRPFPQAYALLHAAEAVLAGSGAVSDAMAPLRTAHRIASRLGALPLREGCVRLARWHRIDLADEPRAVVPQQRQTALDELTERELEILTHLVAGHTNREIAEALFISPKTVSVHVSNILRKLQVSRRFDAARIGHRLGLDQPM